MILQLTDFSNGYILTNVKIIVNINRSNNASLLKLHDATDEVAGGTIESC
jgi:hypothetical protein